MNFLEAVKARNLCFMLSKAIDSGKDSGKFEKGQADRVKVASRKKVMKLSIRNTAKRFARSEKGATAIEYGLIAALISIAALAAMQSLGTAISNVFNTASSELIRATSAG